MLDRTFTIVDVETTGGSPFFDRVIEIGILRIEHGEIVQTYNQLVNPQKPIPEFITGITHITDEDVAAAPLFSDIIEDVAVLFEGAVFVAHNAEFDYGFLKEEFRRHGWGFAMDRLCTVRLSRVLFPEYPRHNLDALIERFGFEMKNRHRAFDDAKILWDFLQVLPKHFESARIDETMWRTMQKLSPKKQRELDKKPNTELTYINEDEAYSPEH